MAHDTAGKEGNRLEATIRGILEIEGYQAIEKVIGKKRATSIYNLMPANYRDRLRWCIVEMDKQPFYITRTRIAGKSIYEVPWNVDIFAWHPEVFPNGLVMEIKQQSIAGSVDEKYPFVVQSLIKIANEINGCSILYVSGGAARRCATEWCLSQEANQSGEFYFVDDEATFRHLIKTGKRKKTLNRG